MGRHGENIRKRKDGRWEARYIKSYDANGKAIYRYLYGKTYMEVKQKRILEQSKNNTGMHRVTGDMRKITFRQLADEWLESK